MRHNFEVACLLAMVPAMALAQSQGTDSSVQVPANEVIRRSPTTTLTKRLANKNLMMMSSSGNPSGPGDTLVLGYGFDVFTGELLNTQCATGTLVGDDPSQHQTADPEAGIRQVSSLSDYRSASNTSGSASLTYKVFSLGGGASAYHSDYFRSFYEYIVVNEQAINRVQAYGDAGATRQVSRLDTQQFNNVCGQMYVQAILYGGALRSIVQLATTYDETHTHNDAQVSAGITGLLGAKGNSSTDTSKITSNAAFNQQTSIMGAPRENLPGIDTLIQYAYAFPTKTQNSDAPVAYVLKSYSSLLNAPRQAKEVPNEALAQIAALASKHDDALVQLNDLRFAKQTGESGVYQPDSNLANETDLTEKYIQQIGAAIDVCETKPIDTCKVTISAIGPVPTSTLKRKA